jgi:hypothetical protein
MEEMPSAEARAPVLFVETEARRMPTGQGLSPDAQELLERIDELESIVRGFLAATDKLTHLEGSPRALADLSTWRQRARRLLDRG